MNRSSNSLEYGQFVAALWFYAASQYSSITAMDLNKTQVSNQLLLPWKSLWESKYCDRLKIEHKIMHEYS